MDLNEAQRLFEGGPEGIEEWNRRRQQGESIPDLREVDLWHKDLSGINLSGARLLGACLCESNLANADCTRAILYQANLQSVKAPGARFVAADLRYAEFGVFCLGLGYPWSMADLTGTDFSAARLSSADLTECIVQGARFYRADLTKADLRYTDFSQADLTEAILDDAIWNDPSPPPPPPPPPHFGTWLREQRESRGLTRADLARQLDLGLCHVDIKLLESKPGCDSAQLALRVARAFGIPVSGVPAARVESENF